MKTHCTFCDNPHPEEDLLLLDGKYLCPDCLAQHTILCSECGTRIWIEDNDGTGDQPLCTRCRGDNFVTCCECEALIPNCDAYYDECDVDDDRPYCSHCFHTAARGAIHDYYYKPEPIFFGEGIRYFGVELEIDGAGECNSNARDILSIANQEDDFSYMKHDGSLDDGMELVTHPMGLDYQLHQMPWEGICQQAIRLGYQSHKISTCGLHVHISRRAFGEMEVEQDAAIARVLYFFEKHWEELLKFSRRTQRQLDRWAARYGYREQPMEILYCAKKSYHGGRYTCVNLQNRDTVEFRMFRGTLKANTIFATLQLLNRICDVAIFMSDDEVKSMAWTTFVGGCHDPELIQYLKERRLYVNEQVETEVEV